MTSLIAGISLFDSFKFTQTRVLEKLMKKEFVDFSQMQYQLTNKA